ncbi:MAG: PqqD family protein [Bacteroidaceae bacterium]|nr:PqqD family protein [Bacteroidaceae bacterium]MBQ9884572.1 PqqD family protein [Bacteroidaceae bacterium]
MKQTFGKPVMHFIPLAEGVEAVSLATLPEGEFTETVRQCKDAEAQRVYQVSSDVIKRQIGDEWILMPTGALAQRFNGMVSLSEVGDFIWEQLQEPKTLNQILEAAHAEFEDVGHMLDIETRKFISDYAFMGFLEELK